MNDINAAIIVTAYRRRRCLRLLWQSIEELIHPLSSGLSVDLIFLIDHSAMQDEIMQICEGFEWPHGKKQIISAAQRVGLKANVLSAFDIGAKYDFFVLLEDDLYLSPYALRYAIDCYDRFSQHPHCLGASLYCYQLDEISLERFVPLTSGLDVFLASVPCSWGCVYWTKDLGETLRSIEGHLNEEVLPHNVKRWSSQSWKKLLYFHMITSDQFLVYPSLSLSTVTSSNGEHQGAGRRFSVPLADRAILMPDEDARLVSYDAYLEISPATLKLYNPVLKNYDFVVNLKNQKPANSGLALVNADQVEGTLLTFDGSFTPPEFGPCHAIAGRGISLARSGPGRKYGFDKFINDLREIFNLGYLRRLLRFGY